MSLDSTIRHAIQYGMSPRRLSFMGVEVNLDGDAPVNVGVMLGRREEVMAEYARTLEPRAGVSEAVREFGRMYDRAVERWRVEQETMFMPSLFGDFGQIERRMMGLAEAFPMQYPTYDDAMTSVNPEYMRRMEETDRAEKEAAIQAERKSGELLKSVVKTEEWQVWQRTGLLNVQTERWAYSIKEVGQTELRHRSGVDAGKLACTACFQLRAACPQKDRVVAEYLMIKNDEVKYLMTANVTWAETETMPRTAQDVYERMREFYTNPRMNYIAGRLPTDGWNGR